MRKFNWFLALLFLVLWFSNFNTSVSGALEQTTTYEVQEGDSLWSIAKQYNKEDTAFFVDYIIDYNSLEGVVLRAGMLIKIPSAP